jgi:hypothetical protein
MKAPVLIGQMGNCLRKVGYKPILYKRDGSLAQLKLKGSIQLNKWIKEIGSSNPRNLDKNLLE